MSRGVGVLRDRDGLEEVVAALLPLAAANSATADPAAVGLMIAVAALRREESRGAHHRTDFPKPAAARRSRLRLDEAVAAAQEFMAPPAPVARRA